MTCPTSEPASLHEAVDFLADYASWMLGCGATCVRLEKNTARIARAWSLQVEMTIMPRHIHLTVTHPRSVRSRVLIVAPQKIPVNFGVNTRLSRLSWRIADEHLSLPEACAEFHRAIAVPAESPLLITLLVGLAGASFCRLFGGDIMAMTIVAAATMAGVWLRRILTHAGCDSRVVVFLCAFVSAVFGATDMLFSLGNTPAVALGTSVLYLVPGIPFLNSFSDMIYRHYICAFSRLVDALVLTCCLSAGLCLGMRLMNAGMF